MYHNHLSIKKWAEEDRPREKISLKGHATLSTAELLSIIIGSGYKNVSALDLAQQILRTHDNSIRKLARLSIADLCKFKGIGEVKASMIIAALELGRRRQSDKGITKAKIASSLDAFALLNAEMSDLNHEEFKAIMLNRNNQVLKIETISVGGIAGTVVDPKIVFKKALDLNASSVILIHNHPSGNLNPSKADIDITSKLVNAGTHLDISVLDHLIIADGRYYSFADEGRI